MIPAAWLPKPEDELLHEPWGDASFPWKDTWFITLRDDAINANLTMHMTVSADRSPTTRIALAIAQGNRGVNEVLRADGDNTDSWVGNALCQLEFVNLSWDSDHELRFTGRTDDVEFELTLLGKHFAPLWDTMFETFFAAGRKDGQEYHHAEQMITADGWLRWRGEEAQPFSGFGWRDRGWGRRKTQIMWDSGWDLVGAVLPDDSVFSFMALRNHEVSKDAPLPVAGWRSDAESLSPCVGGLYHKQATAFPLRIELSFLDGTTIAASQVRPTGSVATALQEPEVGPDAPGVGISMRDHYAVFADDATGREFGVFTQNGWVHRVDVFRGAEFKYVDPPAG